MDDLVASLQTHFGFSNFRPGQAEAIHSLLNGQHTLVVMPTGSGKSLVFQLGGLLLPGITLVISPLIALMKDQVDSLERRGIAATFINSALPAHEQSHRLKRLSAGGYQIVYVAPERLRSTQFLASIKGQKIGLLAIDEAHCISEWGHDFRPDYLRIAAFRRALGNPLTAALTATATPQVQEDIARLLHLPYARRVVTGFNRPNLALEVRYTADPESRLRVLQELLADHRDGAAIIYTGTRRDAEEAAEFARTVSRSRADYYHAGLPPEERTRIQDAFMAGDLRVVAATNAFGMGIDRPDVRQVIHFSLPGSLEAYYQEAGRAGRDDLPARAALLYLPEDRALQEWFIEASTITEKDLRTLFDALRPAGDGQVTITINELSHLTSMPEVKLRVGLSALENAGALVHLGVDSLRMHMQINNWEPVEIRAATERLSIHQSHRRTQLEHMIVYAESNACRRRLILKHFGDAGPAEAEVCCDNCQSRKSSLTPARKVETLPQADRVPLIVLDTVRRLQRGVGREKIILILRGSKAKEILKFGYEKNVYYGRLAALKQTEIKRMIDQLCTAGYLKVIGGEYPVLHLTPQGETAIRDKVVIPLNLPDFTSNSKSIKNKPDDRQDRIAATILECVYKNPGELPSSGIAKLLVGSPSERVQEYRNNPFYNKLTGYSSSQVLDHVNQLLASGQLAQDENKHVIPGCGAQLTKKIPVMVSKTTIHHVVTLGESKSVSAISELIDCLQNPNGNIRRLAASALGKIANKQATKPLIELLSREKKHQVRQYAVKALGKIKDQSTIPILEAITRDPYEKEYTRVAARYALQGLGSKKATHISSAGKDQPRPTSDTEDPVTSFLSRAHPRQLPGPWYSGWALGFHSQYTGANWSRSGTGELAYRLKYQSDLTVLPLLVEQALALIGEHPELAQVDAIIPVPPSTLRPNDPVSYFAKALAQKLQLPYQPVVIKSRQTAPQKEMHTLAQKQSNVTGAFKIQSSVKGKRLLVVDDLFDSGATLLEMHRQLYRAGAVKVNVLTLTRTIHADK